MKEVEGLGGCGRGVGPRFEAVGVEHEEVVGEDFEDGFWVFFGDGAGTAEEL